MSNCSSILPKSSASHNPYVRKTLGSYDDFLVSTKLLGLANTEKKEVEILEELISVVGERLRLRYEITENYKREASLVRKLSHRK